MSCSGLSGTRGMLHRGCLTSGRQHSKREDGHGTDSAFMARARSLARLFAKCGLAIWLLAGFMRPAHAWTPEAYAGGWFQDTAADRMIASLPTPVAGISSAGNTVAGSGNVMLGFGTNFMSGQTFLTATNVNSETLAQAQASREYIAAGFAVNPAFTHGIRISRLTYNQVGNGGGNFLTANVTARIAFAIWDGTTETVISTAQSPIGASNGVVVPASALPVLMPGAGCQLRVYVWDTSVDGGAANRVNVDNIVLWTQGRQAIVLRKAWTDARINDESTVSMIGVPATLVSTADSANEIDSSVAIEVNAGDVLSFDEIQGATNVGAYRRSFSCTGNANAPGGMDPGTRTLLISNSDINLICTFANTRRSADLRLTKTNTPGLNGDEDLSDDTLVQGATTHYAITVTNLGPDSADGAVVIDPVQAHLSCSTASCTATGGAACPSMSGLALVSALQGGGAAIPVLPSAGSVVISMTCAVN